MLDTENGTRLTVREEGFVRLTASSVGKTVISLALQGGGSFGAFTWGVLDRLLEEPTLHLDIVSGASAGAVNAVLVASGLQTGGREGARATLRQFWEGIRQAEPVGLLGFAYPVANAALRFSAQVGLTFPNNPGHFNPLRDILAKAVDFERLRAAPPLRLLVAATRVRDGRLQLFREHEMTLDMVLASACLPTFQKAVEIDGEAYWDGGFSANPPLRQLVRETSAPDVVLVQIMPEARPEVPTLSADVLKRMSEIAFTAPLQRELEALADLREACTGPTMLRTDPCRKLEAMRFHRIAAVDLVERLDQENAMDTGWELLTRLHGKGREAASCWLSDVGQKLMV
jgi:NTE family protein